MIDILAIRPFGYSYDGFTILRAAAGEVVSVPQNAADGLVAEGFAKLYDGGSHPARPASEVLGAGDGSAENGAGGQRQSTASKEASGVDIPDDWRDLHHMKLIPLAKKFDPDVATKDAAIAVIEAELAKRA